MGEPSGSTGGTMKGRLASGWTRLWIAVSVLWIVPVLILGGVVLHDVRSTADMMASELTWACKDYSTSPETDLLALYGQARLIKAYKERGGDTPEHRKIVQDCGKALTKDYGLERRHQLAQTVGFSIGALLPPIVLLALGYLVA